MATKFQETPDALNGTSGDSQTSFWGAKNGTLSYDTSTAKSGIGSWKTDATASNLAANLQSPNAVVTDAGSRVTVWMNFTSVTGTSPVLRVATSTPSQIYDIKFSGSKLQIASGAVTKTGSTTVTSNTWHRISVAHVITSTSNYTISVWLDGNLEATMTNADGTLAASSSSVVLFGCVTTGFGVSQQCYFQHVYIDDSNALTDIGDIRVTNKRPNADGANNQFTTQIGVSGSGYGTGHSPQVNERPVSTTNAWQSTTTSGTKTEDYAIESSATGDVDISAFTQVAYTGWLWSNTGGSGAVPTTNLLLNAVSTSISISSTATLFKKIVDSATYPATAPVIGMNHTGTGRSSQLTDCGIMVSYKGGGVSLSVTCAGVGVLTGTMGATVPLADTLPGTGTLSPTFSATAAFTDTLPGVGTLTMSASSLSTALTAAQAGVGSLAATFSLSTALAVTEEGVGTLTMSAPVLTTALAVTISSTGALTMGAPTLTTTLTDTLPGVGILTPTLSASLILPSLTIAGVGTLAATLGVTGGHVALSVECDGAGTLSGAFSATVSLASTIPGVGTLTATVSINTDLSDTLAGAGSLIGTLSARVALTDTLVGVGTLTADLTGGGALSVTLTGAGTLTPTLSLNTALTDILSGIGTLSSSPGASLALPSETLAGTGTLTPTLDISAVLTGVIAGVGSLSASYTLSTSLTFLANGLGQLSGSTADYHTIVFCTVSGVGSLDATLRSGIKDLVSTSYAVFRVGKHRTITCVLRAETPHIQQSRRDGQSHINEKLRSELQRLLARF